MLLSQFQTKDLDILLYMLEKSANGHITGTWLAWGQGIKFYHPMFSFFLNINSPSFLNHQKNPQSELIV